MAPDSGKAAAEEVPDKKIEPVFIRTTVCIREGDNLAFRRGDAAIACHGKALIGLPKVANSRIERGNLSARIERSIIHENDFVIGVVQLSDGIETGLQRARAVI